MTDIVECEECGHDILSAHGLHGCVQGEGVTACPCQDHWSRESKRKLCRDYSVSQTGIVAVD